MKRNVALIAAAVAGIGLATSPAVALPPPTHLAPVSIRVPAAQVNYPKAVPGRLCKRAHRGDWTRTKKYGKVKCVNKDGWRWARAS